MNDIDESALNHVRELKAIRERFLAASTRQAACAALPKLSDANMKSVTESWPPAYDRMLGERARRTKTGPVERIFELVPQGEKIFLK